MPKRILIALPLALIGGGSLYFFVLLPWPGSLRDRVPERTSFMEYRLAQARARGEDLDIRHRWVPLSGISSHLRRAVLVAEDARFYDHRGIDWDALREELRFQGGTPVSWTDLDDLRALWASFRYFRENRDRIRGRSTITQQLAKNVYFTPERSVRRKAEELIVTRRIERALEKNRILELYLNVAEWGPGVFGAEAAARHYFGRSAADLTREQAAALAATLPHPLTSNPAHRPGRMAWRQRLILQRMGAAGPVETVPLEPPDVEYAPVPVDTVYLEPIPPPPDTAPPRPDTIRPPPDTMPPRPDTAPEQPQPPEAPRRP